MTLQRCAKCVLPASYPGIAFNDEGTCNYCLAYRKRVYHGERRLKEIIDQYTDYSRDYDCIVGLSGGRDSTYLLHYAVNKLNLRVLAYTIDNGFIPEQPKSNIKAMIEKLGVDHIVEKQDYTRKCLKHFISSWMRRPSAAMVSSMCIGCRMRMVLGFLKTAREYDIPLLLTGGGEPESSFATRFLKDSNAGNSLLVGYIAEMVRNPSYLSSPTYLTIAVAEYVCYFSSFPLVRRLIYPDQKYVPLFRYIEYDERRILSVITDQLNWAKYPLSESTWRSDCKVALFKNYLYQETVGFTKNDELLSGMIRENLITREEALARLATENVVPRRFVTKFLDELGLDYRDMDIALNKARKNWCTRKSNRHC